MRIKLMNIKNFIRLVSLMLILIGGQVALGQTTGDYRSNTTPLSWNTAAGWDRYDGATLTWVANPTQGYPGSSSGAGTVTIQDGHTVTINVSPANTIGALVVGGGTSGTLIMGSSGTAQILSVTGTITVSSGATFRTGSTSTGHTLNIGGNLIDNGTVALYYATGGPSGATVAFNGSSQAILGSATALTMYRMTVNSGSTVSFGDNNNSRSLTLNSNLVVTGTFQSGITAAIAHTIWLGGRLTNDGTIDFTANGATNHTFTFNGAANTTLIGTSTTGYTFNNFTINNSGTTVSFGTSANARTLTISGNLTLTSGTFQSNNTAAVAHVINLSGDFIGNGGIIDLTANSATNQAFNFDGATQTISGTSTSTTNHKFYNLTVNAGATVSFGNNTSNSRILNISKTLTIAATGTLQSGRTGTRAHTINLSGNLSNSGTLALNANSATGHVLNINGATAQSFTGTNSLYNLTINKSTLNSTNGYLTLSGTGGTSVDGALTMTSGKIITSSTHLLTLASGATSTDASSSSFVDGPVVKTIASAGSFTFPMGSTTAGYYRPVTIASTSASDTWTVSYTGSNPNSLYPTTSMQSPVQTVSGREYWNISPLGTATANIGLLYNTGSYRGSGVGTVANLLVAHWNSSTSAWEQAGTGSTQVGATTTTGTVTAATVSSFSPFTLASTDPNSPISCIPTTPTVNVLDNCNGTSTLSTTETGTLLWSTAATTSSINVNSAGTYTVTQTVNGCTSEAGSGVAAPKTASGGGSLAGASTVCTGTNSTLLTLSSYTGNIQWQSSTDNSSFSDLSGQTSATYTATNLTTTTYYRAVVTSGSCPSATSSSAAVTVDPVSVGRTPSPAAISVLAGTGTIITLNGYTGTIQWQQSTDNSNWTDISSATSATYNTPNLTTKTYYRTLVTSGSCAAAPSASISISVTASIPGVNRYGQITTGADGVDKYGRIGGTPKVNKNGGQNP